MKIIKYILIATLLVSSNMVFSQIVLVDKTVEEHYPQKKFGLNRTHFAHAYFKLGFISGDTQQQGVNTKFFSTLLALGVRYKLRINNTFSTGLETEYRISEVYYSVKKPMVKQRYDLQDWKIAWYLRLNFGHRGNHIGKGIDLGVWSALKVYSAFVEKVKATNPDYKYLEVHKKNLSYIEPFYYGFFGRIFYGNLALFVEYRYSDILKNQFFNQYNNIPPLTFGFEVGLHK